MKNCRYQVQQPNSSFGNNFKIKDETDQNVLTIQAKLFSYADKFILEDRTGNSLIKIQQELLNFHPTYKILYTSNGKSDKLLAVVKKNFIFLHNKFTIYSIYGQYLLEDLDMLAHSYILAKHGRTIAVINKDFVSMSDMYNVEINGDQNQAFILALVIAINRCLFNKDKHGDHK